MAPSTAFVLLLATLLVVSLPAPSDSSSSFDLRAKLNHPYAGSLLSDHEMLRDAAMASKARRSSRNAGRVSKPTNYSIVVPIRPFGRVEHTLTVSIGTPPQPRTLILDTGSDLIWTQCKPLNNKRGAYDPAKSSSFAAAPCNGRLCKTGNFNTKNCTGNKCFYTYDYGSATTRGELASETFTFFGVHRRGRVSVSLNFGCGKLTAGNLPGASGILGVSPDKLSLISQLQIHKFSYCLTPFLDRNKTSHIFFGATADLSKYNTTGPIQTTSLVANPVGRTYYYYVPLIGISVGTKRLDVNASSFAFGHDGSGGTFVDSGDTTGMLPSVAMEALKKALVEAVKLPVVNATDHGYDYELCFQLPANGGGTVQVPPLVYHFDGGAAMSLRRDSFMVEVSAGRMCLVISSSAHGAIIGNYQQQNMHVLFDVQNHKFSFAPAQCNQI